MTRQRFNSQTKEWEEIGGLTPEAKAAFIHQDTLETPLRHPVTGKIHDSKTTYMEDCAQTGTRVVGNDWLGLERVRPHEDKVTDQVIIDRIHKGEAILRDPAKRRERENLARKMREANRQFMETGKIAVRRTH